ncbi:MAG: choice-of-anchor J domain-containing protein [Prevotellaceae bacterium]|nr:choice-of-anchor J domain-containing protein [Prevotellaceae bacterium]
MNINNNLSTFFRTGQRAMKKNILWAILLLLGVASCATEKGAPQYSTAGLTLLYETFDAMSDESSINQLSGWSNIMIVDSIYTAPLQWLAYKSGCNVVMQASAHKFDDSNKGIHYESWLLSPPLDFDNAVNKTLSFRLLATYWQNSTTLDVFLVPDFSAIKAHPEKLIPLRVNLPTQGNADKWLSSTLDMSNLKGSAMLGFCYRATGGNGASTSFRIDDVKFGDVGSDRNTLLFEELFASGLGDFTAVNVTGEKTWEWNDNAKNAPYVYAAKISGFESDKSYPNEDWLISPSIDLSGAQSATLIFEQSINKGVASAEVMRQEQVALASTGCTDPANPSAADWTPLAIPIYPSGSAWRFACSEKIDLTPYAGAKNLRIAFKYKCGDEAAATWSIANFKVLGGR